MLRRILIIVLVAVVIIAAIFGIRWFLNRDSNDAETTEETPAIVEESEANPEESTPEEGVVDPATDVTDETADASAGDNGEGTVESYPAPEIAEGEVDTAEGNGEGAESGDQDTVTEESGEDAVIGGTTDGTDPNSGGGVPAEGSENTGDAVAVDPSEAGVGGEGNDLSVTQPIAFVQPGVPTQHTAANLEWLTQLARCYGTTVADIQAANNYTCPDLIHPGYVISITNPGNTGTITINDQPCFNYHTVQQGETLYSIANQYGIDYQWLARINAIYNYDYIYAGQQLVIPNPVDSVFTQPPAEPFYYSNCWYEYCPGWQYPPVAVPYGQ